MEDMEAGADASRKCTCTVCDAIVSPLMYNCPLSVKAETCDRRVMLRVECVL